ncbi:hypothetical protein TTHERM_00549550 (macronuclear) [Tetrahymena thermophila SB210]|uniref:Uncharacterized protein n=1 Tax=Tetrahymena thermophila (strain SB210) TaxID=312017 RepID=I7MDB0_TETTS|nr:hypothetical protein TTHERM_00549550 [Tetrahymena thermophila SB210]EAR86108.2 hypothetical protein TTHERM_00549550 [Tetrahymena thermophila SB210]|eukprot:XP_976703.2 hypothetical protein TTHERM_00549550 [Tetrahymena thermophila SB210]
MQKNIYWKYSAKQKILLQYLWKCKISIFKGKGFLDTLLCYFSYLKFRSVGKLTMIQFYLPKQSNLYALGSEKLDNLQIYNIKLEEDELAVEIRMDIALNSIFLLMNKNQIYHVLIQKAKLNDGSIKVFKSKDLSTHEQIYQDSDIELESPVTYLEQVGLQNLGSIIPPNKVSSNQQLPNNDEINNLIQESQNIKSNENVNPLQQQPIMSNLHVFL